MSQHTGLTPVPSPLGPTVPRVLTLLCISLVLFAGGAQAAGAYSVTFDSTDDSLAVDTEAFSTTAPNANQPPELSPLFNVTVDELATVSFPVSAIDSDGPPPVLSSSTLPGSATFDDLDDDGIYTFEWITTYDDSGSYNVTFYATDADFPDDVDSAEVIITVNDVNRTPWLLVPINQPDSVLELDTVQFEVLAWDEDGSIPNITLGINGTGGLLPNMEFDLTWDGTYQNGLLTFTPDYSQGDDRPTFVWMRFYVFDEFDINLTDTSGTWTIKVYNRNQPPAIIPVPPLTAEAGQLFQFAMFAADPDGDSIILTAENMPAAATFVDSGDGIGGFEWIPNPSDAGLHTLSFLASDGSLVDTMVVEITVQFDNCCIGIRGNVDDDPGDAIDISDLVYLVDFMFNTGPAPSCFWEADIDGSGIAPTDISDLAYLVDYMFNGGPEPVACP